MIKSFVQSTNIKTFGCSKIGHDDIPRHWGDSEAQFESAKSPKESPVV